MKSAKRESELFSACEAKPERPVTKRKLEVLNDAIDLSKVRIASPCDEGWDNMVGDERARHCASCDKTVHNFASMTRAEIALLLQTPEVCGRLYMRKDGTFLTADCEVGLAALVAAQVRVNYHRVNALLLMGIALITVALMTVMGMREKAEAVDEVLMKRVYEIRRDAGAYTEMGEFIDGNVGSEADLHKRKTRGVRSARERFEQKQAEEVLRELGLESDLGDEMQALVGEDDFVVMGGVVGSYDK